MRFQSFRDTSALEFPEMIRVNLSREEKTIESIFEKEKNVATKRKPEEDVATSNLQ